jgi:hypothetical protein
MPTIIRENLRPARSGFKLGLAQRCTDAVPVARSWGRVFIKMWDARTGDLQVEHEVPNTVTLDASLLVAALTRDPNEPAHGINMLAVGTGALGAVLNPDKPTNEQRRLNNEIARKPFSETTFRDANGAAVAIRTNVVDYTTIFGESEAVGPLNEMGLLSTISDNVSVKNPNPNFAGQGGQPYDPTVDTSEYDVLVNFLTFGVVVKPATSIFTVTWRLTY